MPTSLGRLESVNLAHVVHAPWIQRLDRTGIDKRPVPGPVATGDEMMVGDTICDLRVHGGADQAAYAYALEDAQWWSAQLSREVRPGMLGENFTTSGIDVTGAVVGERWVVGTAVLEVTRPRVPCRTLAGFWDVPDMIKLFTVAQRPGAYLRIVVPGEVSPSDPIEVTDRPDHGVTMAQMFRAILGDRIAARHALTAPQLPAGLRERFTVQTAWD